MTSLFHPFALSLSKGRSFFSKKGQGFDKLSPNGLVDIPPLPPRQRRERD